MKKKYPLLLAEMNSLVWAVEPNWLNTAYLIVKGLAESETEFIKREEKPENLAIVRAGTEIEKLLFYATNK